MFQKTSAGSFRHSLSDGEAPADNSPQISADTSSQEESESSAANSGEFLGLDVK